MGTTIRFFLTDDNPTGFRYVEISLSTLVGCAIPKVALNKFGKHEKWRNKTAVYILVGMDDKTSRHKLYIGQTENLYSRLTQHAKDKKYEFWEFAIAFLSKDENLNTAHVRSLESVLIAKANETKNSTLANVKQEGEETLSEPEKSDLEKMIEQILLICPFFGVSAFQAPRNRNQEAISEKSDVLHFTIGNGGKSSKYFAKGEINNSQFVIYKDSKANRTTSNSMQQSTQRIREELVNSGVLKESDDQQFYEFTQDYSFNYASAAAQVVTGTTVSGLDAIKIGSKKYKKWIEDNNPDVSELK